MSPHGLHAHAVLCSDSPSALQPGRARSCRASCDLHGRCLVVLTKARTPRLGNTEALGKVGGDTLGRAGSASAARVTAAAAAPRGTRRKKAEHLVCATHTAGRRAASGLCPEVQLGADPGGESPVSIRGRGQGRLWTRNRPLQTRVAASDTHGAETQPSQRGTNAGRRNGRLAPRPDGTGSRLWPTRGTEPRPCASRPLTRVRS